MARTKAFYGVWDSHHTGLLTLPRDILWMIMSMLVAEDANPVHGLLPWLLTTKHLCRPRFALYRTLVNPFVIAYGANVLTKFKDQSHRENKLYDSHIDVMATLRAATAQEPIHWSVVRKMGRKQFLLQLMIELVKGKSNQLERHLELVVPFVSDLPTDGFD